MHIYQMAMYTGMTPVLRKEYWIYGYATTKGPPTGCIQAVHFLTEGVILGPLGLHGVRDLRFP